MKTKVWLQLYFVAKYCKILWFCSSLSYSKPIVTLHKTSISCRLQTCATRCIVANVLQSKVNAQLDKLVTKLQA